MLLILLMLVAVACATAFYRWRWGVFAAIVVGLLQDPLRKMIPGVPGFLAMASLPVWMATLASALFSGEVTIRGFLSNFPRLSKWVSVFTIYLLIPAAISSTYGKNSWQITVLGAVIYFSAFIILAVGWRFPKNSSSVKRVFSFYALCAAVMLIGGPFDYFGFGEGFAAIGTQALDHVWVTYRSGSEGVFMYAGFFRSPDVMGWHAATVTMIAGLLSIRSRGWIRWVWVGISIWGMLNLWICGRRKMIAMLPVFASCLLFLTFKLHGMKRAVLLAGVLSLSVGMAWYGITRTDHSAEVDSFYGSTLSDLEGRVIQHGVGAVKETVRQAGFFGYGLGMGQQGIHHIHAEKPSVWQEGGSGRMVVELGVPGAVLLLVVGGVMLLSAYHVVRMNRDSSLFYLYSGIFSILIANIAAAVVSAQIYGDPFVMLFLAFMLGLLLSGARISQGTPCAVEPQPKNED